MSEIDAVALEAPAVGAPRSERGWLHELGAWYAAEYERLYRFAYLLTRDPDTAEDLVQEAFVRIYRSGRRAQEQSLPAYARRTILNLLRSGLRRRSVERRVLQRMKAEPVRGEPDRESAIDVRRALLTLSIPDRACLALRYYENKTDAEIAEVFGVNEAAAKKRVQRAQQRLRDQLSKEEP